MSCRSQYDPPMDATVGTKTSLRILPRELIVSACTFGCDGNLWVWSFSPECTYQVACWLCASIYCNIQTFQNIDKNEEESWTATLINLRDIPFSNLHWWTGRIPSTYCCNSIFPLPLPLYILNSILQLEPPYTTSPPIFLHFPNFGHFPNVSKQNSNFARFWNFFIIFLKFSKYSRNLENFSIFLNCLNLILVISVLTNRIRDSTRGI